MRWSRTSGLPLTLTALLLATACSDHTPTESSPDEASALSAQVECTVGLEPEAAILGLDALQERLQELAQSGLLSAERASSLDLHLSHARTAVAASRLCEASAQLLAFRTRLESMVRVDKLSGAAASALLTRLRVIEGTVPFAGDPSETYAPGVVGEWRTASVGGQTIAYEVIDGLAIFQGDIILGVADEFEAHVASLAATGGNMAASSVCRFALSCEAWTNGVIGYSFANDWGSDADNATMRARIEAAIRHWEANSSIRFVRRTDGERVVFRNSMGCSSNLGRNIFTGIDPQTINVSLNCQYGTVVHEIGHAIGLFHEQSRDDRDSFVQIFEDRIAEDRVSQFGQKSWLGRDVGSYDYRSVMHYGCDFFQADGETRNTLEPVASPPGQPAVTCADLGQRDTLSTLDIAGVYSLYPPDMRITGAAAGETGDRFTLRLDFTSEPVRDEYIVWSSDRVTGTLATGPTLSTGAVPLEDGEHVIRAAINIGGAVVAERTIRVIIATAAPEVDLGPDRDVPLNRLVFVTADVADAVDGDCPISACTFTWQPAPETDAGGAAGYRLAAEGPLTVSVTVRDGSGRTGTADVTLTAVNSAPVVTIQSPLTGSTFGVGTETALLASATDINEGPDPGPGNISCSDVVWTSSNASDAINFPCGPFITFGDPGVRTLSVSATAPQGLTTTRQVQVEVVACGDNCAPTASIVFSTRSELDGSRYFPTFTGPGYFLDTPLRFQGLIQDLEADSPITYEWRLRLACFGGDCAEIVLESGSNSISADLQQLLLDWTPSDYVAPWSNCVNTALPHTIRLVVRDARGATTTTSREVYLACKLI